MKPLIIRIVGAAILALLTLAAASMGQTPRVALSVVIGLPSFVLMIFSRRQLGTAFSVMPKAKSLVTTGLYSRIQHPMYLFLDIFLLAVIVGVGWPTLLWIWAVLLIVQTIQGRREENVLAATFGADYDAHRRRTWF